MTSLIHWQMVGASTGLVLVIASFLMAAGMKHWLRLRLDSRNARQWHRYTAWGSLATYVLISFTCLKFHFPIADPLAALDYGWFMIHPINGLAGIPLYLGKILVVRRWKKGWKAHGAVFGCALLIFWLIQVGTVAPAFLAWIG